MSILACLSSGAETAGRSDGFMIDRVLQSVRQHLGMEVAYVSEFVRNDSVFRAVDAPGLEALIKPGDSRVNGHRSFPGCGLPKFPTWQGFGFGDQPTS